MFDLWEDVKLGREWFHAYEATAGHKFREHM